MITVQQIEMLLDIKDGIDELETYMTAVIGGVAYSPESPFTKTGKICSII